MLDLGVVKVGETEPLHVEEISRYYEGYESYSGDDLGRSGVILAWHPTEDVLLFLNGQRLRRLDCAGRRSPARPSLAPDWGRLNGDYLAFVPGRRARCSSACSPRTTAPTATGQRAGPGPARRQVRPAELPLPEGS